MVLVLIGGPGAAAALGNTAIWLRAVQGDTVWTREIRGRTSAEGVLQEWSVREGTGEPQLRFALRSDRERVSWGIGHLAFPAPTASFGSLWTRAPRDTVRASRTATPVGVLVGGHRAGVHLSVAAARADSDRRWLVRARHRGIEVRAGDSGPPEARVDLGARVPWRLEVGGAERRFAVRGGAGAEPWALRAAWSPSPRHVDAAVGLRVPRSVLGVGRLELRVERAPDGSRSRARTVWWRSLGRSRVGVEVDAGTNAGERASGAIETVHGGGWRSSAEVDTDRRASSSLEWARPGLRLVGRIRLEPERARSGTFTVAWHAPRAGRIRVGLSWSDRERGRLDAEWYLPRG